MNESSAGPSPAKPLELPDTGSLDLNSNRIEWRQDEEGFPYKSLLEDPAAGIRTLLMKIEPGAYSPPHAHEEFEQVYVLEGLFYDDHKTYRPGEFIVRAPGAMHSAGSANGATLLLVYTPADTRT